MGIAGQEETNIRRTIYSCVAAAASQKADEKALILIGKDGTESSLSWNELKELADKTAFYLKNINIGEGSRVVVAMPNSLAATVFMLGAWHLGSCVFLLSHELLEKERDILCRQIQPELIIAPWKGMRWPSVSINDSELTALPLPVAPLPDISSIPARATATGGSTGIPKIIVEEGPMCFGTEDFLAWQGMTGQHAGQTQLICGSLHHSLFNNSFFLSLAMGNTQVLMRNFNEDMALRCIYEYNVNSFVLVPTMMSRVIRSPELDKSRLAAVECMHHAGASCPQWLKMDWIQLLGPEKVHEFYSMSEKIGMTAIRGDEFLTHPGSVGRACGCKIEILDDNMNPLPAGTVGNVFFLSSTKGAHYLLEEQSLSQAPDGALSVGDLGRLDEEGYLYLLDRRSDMIITGGKNVYAAEVENLIKEYPQVADVLVVGLQDSVWGRRVHAIIEPYGDIESFKLYSFTDFCFRRISNYKLPKTIELVKRIPRDESGKINKARLVEARSIENDAAEFQYIKVPNGHQLMAWRKRKSRKNTQKQH